MMKKLLHLAAIILVGALPARAEVLIYQGTATVLSTPGASFPPVIEIFLVLDIGGKQLGSVIFFKSGGTKTQIGGTPSDFHFTTSPLPGGGTARLISTSSSSEALPNYTDIVTYFRGTQKTLTVATGAFDTTRNEPRTIKGIQFLAAENGGSGQFLEGRFKLIYEEKLTIKANNGTQTIQQALDEIVADLTAKGFNPP